MGSANGSLPPLPSILTESGGGGAPWPKEWAPLEGLRSGQGFLPQEGREVTEKNKGLECKSPLPRRPPAKKELFWVIQPCPATQGGRLRPWERDPLPGLRAESTGREGRASLGSSATSQGCSDRSTAGWEGTRHPWVGDHRLP